ncbi:MAG: RDD family protein [Pseudomonadota bacterium]
MENVETQQAPLPKYAGFWVRAVAKLIDCLVMLPITLGTLWSMSRGVETYLLCQLPLSLLAVAYIVYFNGRYGATIGKRVMKLQVLDISGAKIDYKQALCREIVSVAYIFLSCVFSWLSFAHAPSSESALSLYIGGQQSPALHFVNLAMQLFVFLDILVLVFNKKKRAIHDFIGGTVVVRTHILVPHPSI